MMDIHTFLLKRHERLMLAGDPPNSLLAMPGPLIEFTRALMNGQTAVLPHARESKWQTYLSVLASHEMLPLLHEKIHYLPDRGRLPQTVIDTSRQAFLAADLRSLQVERQLACILPMMDQSGLSCLVMKGPAISGSWYPRPALRPHNDIDLLVTRDQYTHAREVLCHMGYLCNAPRFDGTPDLHSEESFVHSQNRTTLPVELHWDIHHFYGFRGSGKVMDLFLRAKEKTYGEITFMGLDPVDELLHLILHMGLIHTRDIRLIWLYDIFLLTEEIIKQGMWQVFMERCREWRAVEAARELLSLAQFWTPLGLSETDVIRDRWPSPDHEEKRCWEQMMTRHMNINGMISLRLPLDLPLSRKAFYVMRFLFPPRENLRKRYRIRHDGLLPLYYIRRIYERLIRRSWLR